MSTEAADKAKEKAKENAKEKVKDKQKDKHSRVKYIRLFSLLPHKKGFNINSVHLTDSLVEEIYEQKRFNFNRKKVKLENIFNYRNNKNLSKLLADQKILLMDKKKEQKELLVKIPSKYQLVLSISKIKVRLFCFFNFTKR